MQETALKKRISALDQLGKTLSTFLKSPLTKNEPLAALIRNTEAQNKWFTPEHILKALDYWSQQLTTEALLKWTAPYTLKPERKKRVLLIMAGNIPLVGFHDLLSVYLSGHHCIIKPSQKDSALMRFMVEQMHLLDDEAIQSIHIRIDPGADFDAVIATGSNNSGRYFDYYFKKYPHLIRKNRNSVALLTKDTEKYKLELLANDIFDYFGLGCRNVTQLLIERGFELNTLTQVLSSRNDLLQHNKYANNVEYQRSLLLLNQAEFIDAETILMVEDDTIHSPIGVLHYKWVENQEEADNWTANHSVNIQCSVGPFSKGIPFGQSQQPTLDTYADQIDTLTFLSNL
ncbi:MAG: acyl-CoA reductase [Flavobacteriaceae bacterium]